MLPHGVVPGGLPHCRCLMVTLGQGHALPAAMQSLPARQSSARAHGEDEEIKRAINVCRIKWDYL